MKGIVTVKVKEGVIFQGNIWEIIYLLAFKNNYIFRDDIVEINIDGQVIPKPKHIEDDT